MAHGPTPELLLRFLVFVPPIAPHFGNQNLRECPVAAVTSHCGRRGLKQQRWPVSSVGQPPCDLTVLQSRSGQDSIFPQRGVCVHGCPLRVLARGSWPPSTFQASHAAVPASVLACPLAQLVLLGPCQQPASSAITRGTRSATLMAAGPQSQSGLGSTANAAHAGHDFAFVAGVM